MSNYEIRVSKKNKDVLTSTDPNDFIMHSRYNTFKILETGSGTKTASGAGGSYAQSISISRPNASCFLLYIQFPDGKVSTLYGSYLGADMSSFDYSSYKYQSQILSPGTIVTDNSGNKRWENVNDAKTSNNVRAYTVFDRYSYSDWMKCTDFGFSIPSDTVIAGIKAEVEGYYSGEGTVTNYSQIYKAGSGLGAEYEFGLPESLSNESYSSMGGISSFWNGSFTPSDINNSGFGVGVLSITTYMERDELGDYVGVVTTYVDHVRITVYYSYEPYVSGAYINTAGNTLGFTIHKPGSSDYTIKYRYFIFEPPL